MSRVARSVGLLLLLCAPVFAQEIAPAIAPPAIVSDAPPTLASIPTADELSAQLQPFVLASENYSSSRDAFDSEPLGSAASFAHPDPIISNERRVAPPQKMHWTPMLWQSARFLLVMHAFRLATEPSTRAELKGPFFGDYFDSVMGTWGWRDGDPKLVNYIGHPMEGSVSGFIFLQNNDRARNLEFDVRSKAYWKSRFWASVWMCAYSLQFELGPVSEASIGNVGKVARPDGGSYMAAVDLVVTPSIGFAWMVGEDFLDRHAVRGLENHTDSRVLRALARGFLNPSRSFANMMRGKAPWFRDTRPLSGRTLVERPAPLAEPANSVAPPPRDAGTPATRSGH
jgi:hypothetical protein